MQYNTVQYNTYTIQYNTIQYNTMQYIPLISRVQGSVRHVMDRVFSLPFIAQARRRAGHENKEGENEDP